jgi:hypothetical protein
VKILVDALRVGIPHVSIVAVHVVAALVEVPIPG